MTVDPSLPSRLIDQESRYGASNYRPFDLICARADGAYLWDVQGGRYLDFLAGCGAVAQGHNHTRIAAAMVEQCLRLCLSTRACRNDRLPPLLEKLCTLSGFEQALLMNSGAEAVETAIKGMRKWAYDVKGVAPDRAEIIVAQGNFHGRTTTIIGFSTDPDSTTGFGPFTPGFKVVPYGDLAAVAAAITPNTAGIFMEPIQGEAGVLIPPAGFLKGLSALADQHHCLLVLDEIQSGFGRTGKMFAFEHEAIRPDGITVGKALSGGFYPVSAFLASREIMDVFTPGIHGSTYGGNPLACAVASAALDVLIDERLVERSAELGRHFKARLEGIKSNKVKAVRCLGLWAGIDLTEAAGPAKGYCYALKDRGMLCKDTHVRTIRLAPPLVITKAQIDWAVDQLEAVLK